MWFLYGILVILQFLWDVLKTLLGIIAAIVVIVVIAYLFYISFNYILSFFNRTSKKNCTRNIPKSLYSMIANNKLIDEISDIVSKYGKDIVTEERFVYILKDLYPDIDNQERFRIINSIIKEGILDEMLNDCNKSNLYLFVKDNACKIAKKYSYSSREISTIIYSFSIGLGIITKEEYEDIKKGEHSRQKTKAAPSPSIAPNRKNPKPHTNPAFPLKIKLSSQISSLVWALFGIIFIPFIYLGLINNGWWPFWGVVFIVIFSLIFFIPGILNILDNKKQSRAFIIGGFSCELALLCLFMIVGPFFIDWTMSWFNLQYSFYGYNKLSTAPFINLDDYYSYEVKKLLVESPSILTFVLGVSYSFIAYRVIFKLDDYKGTIINCIKSNRKSFLKGVFWIGLIILLIASVIYTVPIVSKYNNDKKIDAENKIAKNELLKVMELKKNRSMNNMGLSFKDFYLGDSVDHCLAVINDTEQYKAIHMKDSKSLVIDTISYSEIVDSIVCTKTEWDNQEASVFLFSNNGKVIALMIETDNNINRIISLYTKKYGQPEYEYAARNKFFRDYRSVISYDNQEDSLMLSDSYKLNGKFYIEQTDKLPKQIDKDDIIYSWTFKNSIIQIYKSGYSSYAIIYFDKKSEVLLKEYKRKIREEQDEKNRIADSIRLHKEKVSRQKAIEEQKRKQDNHKKAINQI